MKEKQNYTAAFEELQRIVASLEQGDTSVDDLSEKIRRAGVLIKLCREKLTKTEENVATILQELEADEK